MFIDRLINPAPGARAERNVCGGDMRDQLRSAPPERKRIFWSLPSINISFLRDEELLRKTFSQAVGLFPTFCTESIIKISIVHLFLVNFVNPVEFFSVRSDVEINIRQDSRDS